MGLENKDLLKLIEATEKKTEAEIQRRIAEENKTSELRKLRLAEERKDEILEELLIKIKDLIKILDSLSSQTHPIAKTIRGYDVKLDVMLEIQRLIIPKLIREGSSDEEIKRLTELLKAIGTSRSDVKVGGTDVNADTISSDRDINIRD